MKIVTIVGARPQFIKATPVSSAIETRGHQEVIVHTGQHYDDSMSAVFFRELTIKAPDINLNVGSGSHGIQTGQMLVQIEKVLLSEKPDIVLVYGDTNSTLAGALAACKLHIPVAHIEAGLRSFNKTMPEEYNRVLTDHCSNLLFCPTQTAVTNLAKEGIKKGVHLVGDTMYDAVLRFSEVATKQSTILEDLKIKPKDYLLATVHRPYNVDNPENLQNILNAFIKLDENIIFPIHPRTKERIEKLDKSIIGALSTSRVKMIEPVGYLNMLLMEKHARLILTDSGGIQKEAYWFNVPCVTLREETEWVELVEHGFNLIAGNNAETICQAYSTMTINNLPDNQTLYGDGKASRKIIQIISDTITV